MKSVKVQLLILFMALFTLGCQNSGELLESSQSPFCTACKSETKTTLIKGLNNKNFKCPKCDTVREYDDNGQEIIHTCTKCGRALEKCPICVEQET